MSNRNDSDLVLIVVGIVTAAIAFFVWKFSTLVGLDMPTGLRVLVGMAVVIGMVVAADKIFAAGLGETWPLAIAGIWIAWWPALDYWALHSGIIPVWNGFDGSEAVAVWWSTGYTKWGVAASFIGIGYSLRKWMRD